MNGPTLLVLAGVIAFVLRSDTPQLKAIRTNIEQIPAYVTGEVREGGSSLSWDCEELREELRKDLSDAPEHAESMWRHIRSSVLYTLADGSRIVHRLYGRREVASIPANADPNQPAPRKSD